MKKIFRFKSDMISQLKLLYNTTDILQFKNFIEKFWKENDEMKHNCKRKDQILLNHSRQSSDETIPNDKRRILIKWDPFFSHKPLASLRGRLDKLILILLWSSCWRSKKPSKMFKNKYLVVMASRERYLFQSIFT